MTGPNPAVDGSGGVAPSSSGQRILVIGVGAIGGLIAGKLAAVPQLEVHVAARTAAPYLAIRSGAGVVRAPVSWHTAPPDANPFDWVVLATKTYDVGSAGPWMRSCVGPETVLVVAQNGVEQRAVAAQWVTAARTLPAIVTHGAMREGAGRIVHTLPGAIRVPDTDAGRRWCRLTAGSGLAVSAVDDFGSALWTKLAYNLVGNSLSTITGLPVRCIAQHAGLRLLAGHLVRECVAAVAATDGIQLPGELAEQILRYFETLPADVRSSMLQDRDAGRRLEHQAISGAVVRAATRAGIAAPYSVMTTELLDALS